MTFLQPALLWGLIALAVPIIVHFFYLRRSRKYVFTQTRLLEKLLQASRPYLRINHLILLLIRLAIVVVIVLLFAKPVWSTTPLARGGKVSALIVVDVSPSMREKLPGGLAFLRQVLSQERDLEEVKVLSTERLYAEGRFRSVREGLEALHTIQPTDMGYPLSRVLQNLDVHFAGAQGEKRRVYILSDFQAASVGDVRALPKEAEYVLLPMPLDLAGNAYIDSVRVRYAGGQRILAWHLQGDKARSYTLRLGEERTRIAGPGWQEAPWPPSQGALTLEIAGDAVSFDNRFAVGLLQGGERERGMSLESDVGVPGAFTRLSRLLGIPLKTGWNDSAAVAVWVDALPADGRWATWVEKGGLLVVFPPRGLNTARWSQSFLSRRLELTSPAALQRPTEGLRPLRHELWEGVFQERPAEGVVPAFFQVRQLYQFRSAGAYPLLATDGGEVLLWEVPWGNGRVYLFTFPWADANFGEQSLFPVFFERVYALRSGQRSEVGAVFLGRTQNVSLPGAESPIRLKALQGGMEIVPPQRRAGPHVEIQIGDYPLSAGLYAVLADKVPLGYLGVNISPEESASPPMALSSWEAAGLRTRIVAPEGSASEKKGWALRWRGWQLWALLAVALLMLEAWWAKRLLRVPLPVGAAPVA